MPYRVKNVIITKLVLSNRIQIINSSDKFFFKLTCKTLEKILTFVDFFKNIKMLQNLLKCVL